MKRTIDAIYENGAFRPVHGDAVVLADGQRVRITVEEEPEPAALRLAANVYAGLTAEEIDAVERIALDRGAYR